MRIAVIGTGGVGGAFGAAFAQAGEGQDIEGVIGFYGPPVYLHAVQAERQWSVVLVSTAVTIHFLAGAVATGSGAGAAGAAFGTVVFGTGWPCATAKVVPSVRANAANNADPTRLRNVFHRSNDEFITDLSSFLRAPIQLACEPGPRVPALGSIPELRRGRG